MGYHLYKFFNDIYFLPFYFISSGSVKLDEVLELSSHCYFAVTKETRRGVGAGSSYLCGLSITAVRNRAATNFVRGPMAAARWYTSNDPSGMFSLCVARIKPY